MKKYLLIKIIVILIISILLVLKSHNDGKFILLSSLFVNVIMLFVVCFLCKSSIFKLFLKRYIGASALFLLIEAVFVSVYYKEKSNDIGMLILLLTLSDVVFLFYFKLYEFFCENIKFKKIKEITNELKHDIKCNNYTNYFYNRNLGGNNELKTPLNNPASGLPMINSSIDIGGNAYGTRHR